MVSNFSEIASEMEKIISKNLENRGMAGIKLSNQLFNTADELNKSDVVIIVTGFYVNQAKIGETDGPLGALSMAYALCQLDKEVIIVTDDHSAKFIEAGKQELRLSVTIYSVNHEDVKTICEHIIEKHKPQHIIAIERPGKSKEGKYHSMLGEDITEYVPNLDYLFELAKKNHIKTSAIGDGGNEIGMGKIMDYVYSIVNQGEKIAAVTETDNLIIAGVSNWGGHAVSAMLSIINNKMLMYDVTMEARLLEVIVSFGAVDGCIKKPIPMVDGLSLEENLEIMTKLINKVHII